MRDLTTQEIATCSEIATFLQWNSFVNVVIWVDHNSMRSKFSECITTYLKRSMLVPGIGEVPAPEITVQNVGELALKTGSHVFILPLTNAARARGRTINRAYVPRQVVGREDEIEFLLQCMVPTLSVGGILIRYDAGTTTTKKKYYSQGDYIHAIAAILDGKRLTSDDMDALRQLKSSLYDDIEKSLTYDSW